MDEHEDGKPKRATENEVWAAISAFEQILEAIPNDRDSLEALAHAYQQIGDHTQAKDYLVRLGELCLNEGDLSAARGLVDRLVAYSQDDRRVEQLLERIRASQGAGAAPDDLPPAAPAAGTVVEDRKVNRGFSMAEELSCAWSLLQGGEVTEEQYASLVQDLGEMSLVEGQATVSVLHVLEARAAKNLDRVISYMSRECGAPFVAVSSFEMRPEVAGILPLDFMVKRGALPFGTVGKDALVAVMNPYSAELRQDIETLAGRKCHYFVALPSDFDLVLNRIREATDAPRK